MLGTEAASKLGSRGRFLLGQTGKAVPDDYSSLYLHVRVGIQGIHCALTLLSSMATLHNRLKVNI